MGGVDLADQLLQHYSAQQYWTGHWHHKCLLSALGDRPKNKKSEALVTQRVYGEAHCLAGSNRLLGISAETLDVAAEERGHCQHHRHKHEGHTKIQNLFMLPKRWKGHQSATVPQCGKKVHWLKFTVCIYAGLARLLKILSGEKKKQKTRDWSG